MWRGRTTLKSRRLRVATVAMARPSPKVPITAESRNEAQAKAEWCGSNCCSYRPDREPSGPGRLRGKVCIQLQLRKRTSPITKSPDPQARELHPKNLRAARRLRSAIAVSRTRKRGVSITGSTNFRPNHLAGQGVNNPPIMTPTPMSCVSVITAYNAPAIPRPNNKNPAPTKARGPSARPATNTSVTVPSAATSPQAR